MLVRGNSWCFLLCVALSTNWVLPGMNGAVPESFHSLTYRHDIHDLDILHTLRSQLCRLDPWVILAYGILRLLAAIVLGWRSMPSI
jgi:hypothetical protein